jgi:hypothetical protein
MTRKTDQLTVVSGINSAYPVAGQDNDSQGFRDNFSTIKKSLNSATNWLGDLQDTTAKVIGTDGLATTNVFNYSTIENAILRNNSQQAKGGQDNQAFTLDPITQSTWNVNYQDGNHQILGISTSTTLLLANTGSNWPDQGYAQMRLQIIPQAVGWLAGTTTQMTITFANPGGSKFFREPGTGNPWTSTFAVSSLWDVWTSDAGANVFVKYLGTYTSTAA